MSEIIPAMPSLTHTHTQRLLVICYILYGCETCSLTATMEKYDQLLRCGYIPVLSEHLGLTNTHTHTHKKSQEFLAKVKIKTSHITTTLGTRKNRYFGHIKGHISLQTTIIEGKIEGKRGRGRKRTSGTMPFYHMCCFSYIGEATHVVKRHKIGRIANPGLQERDGTSLDRYL